MNCQYCLTPMGNGKFCPSCGAAAAAAPPPPAQPEQPPAWNNDPRNVNVNPQPGFAPQQPAWQQQPAQQPAWQPVPQPARRPFYARWWFWLLVVFGVFFVIGFFAAGGGEGLSEQELVGRWGWDENTRWHYIFNEDGTGSRSTDNFGREQFYWSVSGRTLRIESQTNRNLQWGMRIERWTMRYNNGTLSLSLQGTTYRYIRTDGGGGVIDVEPTTIPADRDNAIDISVSPEQLQGTWNWDERPTWQYFFAPNGVGTRGGGGAAVEEFSWDVEGGVLFINSVDGDPLQFGVAEERWVVLLINNQMILTSMQAEDMSFVYLRAD
ncbi:MAG: hypothetical protein FWE40_06405 [Oscillospiraceae bacterium]|nr:hypothetical protein [Oscillospiraceae bacterium]